MSKLKIITPGASVVNKKTGQRGIVKEVKRGYGLVFRIVWDKTPGVCTWETYDALALTE